MRQIIPGDKPVTLPKLERSKTVIYRTPSPLDGFLFEQYPLPDGTVAFRKVSDIKMLLNEDRLAQLNPTYVQQMLAAVRSSSVDTSQFSDEQLIESIKSRYIQSNADVYNYTRMLQSEIDSVVADIKAKAEARMAVAAAQEVSTPEQSKTD